MCEPRGAVAAVSEGDDAPTPRKTVFLDEQLVQARNRAGLAASALAMACRGDTPGERLSALAQAACLAAAELRMAIQARSLAN